MRFARLGVVLLALLGVPRAADAYLLARALAAGEQAGGGGPPPPPQPQAPQTVQPPEQPDDLTAWAGAARATALPELLQSAILHTPSLASARLDIAIAEARIYQTYARDDWQIDARLTVNSSQSYFSGVYFDRSTTVRLAADVYRALPTGGTVTLHGGTQFNRSPSFVPGEGKVNNWADEITGTIAQPLLRKRGRLLWDAAERKATLARDAAVLARRLAAIAAVQAVIAAYWDLVLTER
jgi:hypothetical protein